MWAGIVAFFRTYKLTTELAQLFVEAWISAQVREITQHHERKNLALREILKGIEEARNERNSEKLIALNHALAIVRSGRLE